MFKLYKKITARVGMAYTLLLRNVMNIQQQWRCEHFLKYVNKPVCSRGTSESLDIIIIGTSAQQYILRFHLLEHVNKIEKNEIDENEA